MSTLTAPKNERTPASGADPAYHSQSGQSKVERYGWPVVDRPGELKMLPKGDLIVDDSYQREEIENKIREIASAWSWMACGVILVARRAGRHYVYDGFQRASAARRRTDITHLPCLIFETAEVSDEAGAFLRVNAGRKPVTAVQKFKAMIVVEDPHAVLAAGLIREAGYEVAASAYGAQIKCVGVMLRLARTDAATLQRVWPLVVEASDGMPIHERLLAALWYIEGKSGRSGVSLLDEPWRTRVLALGRVGIVDAANKASAYFARGGPKVWASGVVDALNKGVRNKLSLDGPSDDAP